MGDPTPLIGPEAQDYAQDRSFIRRIRMVLVYRESAEPEYPEIRVHSMREVLEEVLGGQTPRRVGIVGWTTMPVSMCLAVREAVPNTELIKADDLIAEMRSTKSEAEIRLLREAAAIGEKAIGRIVDAIQPGMTGLQVVGVA
ncbi:MAG TPA: aminopeptidase P family N-terminal domain-containing protein [bacterium]|nr:aminopeptidase P family N-terminal domain-containing protein [bacterium]